MTDETNEIICPDCNHSILHHNYENDSTNGCALSGCACTHSDQYVRLAVRIAELEGVNGKLREALSDNNAALILATGELQQRGFHVGLVVVKMIQSARALLAATASIPVEGTNLEINLGDKK